MKDPIPSLLVLVMVTLAPSIYAWGDMGHQTIAYIASNFVTSATKNYCQSVLDDTSTAYLANAATWADTYRYTSAGAFSKPFHFIDANDSPPKTCDVEYSRDCGDAGCSISAINNYTNILLSGQDLDSLKFILHFVGDIHQPLHDEALEYGCNDVDVTFNGDSTNLHHIWDTEILTKLAGGTTISTALAWSKTLTTSIQTGAYADDAAAWIADLDISDPVTSATSWASEANAYVCSEVLAKGLTYIEDEDLAGAYYTTAVPVVQIQIARAGYRLAAWLNLIVTGSTGL
ncbi:MAG: hypothetical protein M1818_007734 [Claussenomyces sp. TS43310]|nr:MAG: hypothetical protein M1818_007734 [Claussenomyces sp. TS43310]